MKNFVDNDQGTNAPDESTPEHSKSVSMPTNGTCLDSSLLLNAMWRSPAAVHQISVQMPNGQWTSIAVSDAEEAVSKAAHFTSIGASCYFACAEYKTPESRKRENVAGAWVFWKDVDVGPDKVASGKGYLTLAEADLALQRFCETTGLPDPTHLVASGGGRHAYWVLDNFVEVDEWRAHADRLKALAEHCDLLAEPPRFLRRLQLLRRWSHEEVKQVLT